MCLIIESQDEYSLEGQEIFYKVLYIGYQDTRIMSPFFFGYVWKPGWNKATGEVEIYKSGSKMVLGEGAIHVFTDKVLAQDAADLFNGRHSLFCDSAFVTEVTGRGFVAAGHKEAAFKEVYLSQEEYDRIIKLKKEALFSCA